MGSLAGKDSYFKALTERINSAYLVWVEQFLDILEEEANLTGESAKSLNDAGSNVGQFWKGLKRRNLNIDYCGYELEPSYLGVARSLFPEAKFVQLDLSREPLERASFSVMSATLEHLEQLQPGLNHFLDATGELFILRTFLGETSKQALMKFDGTSDYYFVNQYSFEELLGACVSGGFDVEVRRDRFTDSLPKFLARGIIRTQYIVLGKRKALSS